MSGDHLLDLVTVVVVTHHSAHCLDALSPLLAACPHVVVSDNASNDGTPKRASDLWPHAKVLAHPSNLGFGAANNRALEIVQTPFAFLLNPDCEISAQGLVQLIEAAQAMPKAAVIAPQLVSARGEPEVNYRWPNLFWKPKGPGAAGPVCVGFVCGAAMLFRLQAFEGIGFFDEAFFLYYEDDDLCFRLFNARAAIVVWPEVTAVHRSRGSVRGTSPWRSEYLRGYHHAQSKLIYVHKHQSLRKALRKRRGLMWLTALALPLRFVVFSPKLIARMWGRFNGLLRWSQHEQ